MTAAGRCAAKTEKEGRLNFVPYGLHGPAQGYLVSGASLGAAAGAILAGPSADRFGRKTLLIADAGIYATGAIMSAVTPDAAALLFARTGRAGHRRGLRDRHRLPRRVRAQEPARIAGWRPSGSRGRRRPGGPRRREPGRAGY